MILAEYAQYDGLGLAELVKRREVTSKRLGDCFLAAVQKVNPKINAVIETYPDRIDGQNQTARLEGPFAGVPFLMKDLGATEEGKRQESGSRLMIGHVADKDSFLTTLFKRAGLSLLGRSATPEFGMADTTESVLTGPTRNPWNLEMSVGGSSGGAAASVAAGILPVAMASDAGGSIRIPASACGVVGLKPSRGRITLGPDFGERWGGLVQEFVVTRSVRDTAAMLDVVSQPAPGDPFVIIQPQQLFHREVNAPFKKLRIAWTTQSWQPGTLVNPEVVRSTERVAAHCEELRHDVAEATPTFDYEDFLSAVSVGFAFGFDVAIEELASQMKREITEETLEPIAMAYYRAAKRMTAADWNLADRIFNKIRRAFGRFFQKYDVLLTPTLAQPPQPLGKYAVDRVGLDSIETHLRLNSRFDMYLPLFNITGQPAISLPLGQTNSRLPIGAQFVGRFGEEAVLIRLAGAFERTMPWRDRIPPVHVSR